MTCLYGKGLVYDHTTYHVSGYSTKEGAEWAAYKGPIKDALFQSNKDCLRVKALLRKWLPKKELLRMIEIANGKLSIVESPEKVSND